MVSTIIQARKVYCVGGNEIMKKKKKKYSRAERKRAWECYVDRLTMPFTIHFPTEEEKEMLRKAGYDVK